MLCALGLELLPSTGSVVRLEVEPLVVVALGSPDRPWNEPRTSSTSSGASRAKTSSSMPGPLQLQ